jgi:hypothetical protein
LVKRTISLAVGLCLSFLCCSVAQPKVEVVGGTTYDFGSIYQGNKAEHIFELKNVGNDTLRIGKVETSCGCTAAMMSRDSIPPGQIGKLSVAFNSGGYIGSVSKSVFVGTNDTSQPLVTLHIALKIIVEIEVQPSYITLQDLKIGQTAVSDVVLKNASAKDIKLLGADRTEDNVKFNVPEQILPAGQSCSVQLSITGNKLGPLYGTIKVKTDSEIQREVEVRYFANVVQ